jgi:hypothetical protein
VCESRVFLPISDPNTFNRNFIGAHVLEARFLDFLLLGILPLVIRRGGDYRSGKIGTFGSCLEGIFHGRARCRTCVLCESADLHLV